ncbi:MAG TPA: plastocyanin/azurin family copper-binding protein [Solirubrobacteraceae bacterium]|nr:plastocyanin/azurin family copper-binding protein [Solirubrobacteraceae bacterium]
MSSRGLLAGTAAATLAVAFAPAALAQSPVVQAVDGTQADNYDNRWSPASVTIKTGESVTWSFAGSGVYHNVISDGANWSFRNGDPAIAPPPASYRFTAPGTYRFVCQIHATTMVGTVIVTDASGNPPPPPPPPPLSEQPFPNDAGSPGAFEVADTLGPRLSRTWARGRRHAARVGFRLDEPALVTVRVRRARVTVKRKRGMYLRGRRTLTIRRLPAGRYRLDIAARDLAGNRSRVRHVRVTVR